MKNAFGFLGLTQPQQQRDLIAQLQAAGAFDVREATRYLNLIPKNNTQIKASNAPSLTLPLEGEGSAKGAGGGEYSAPAYVMLDPAQVKTDAATYQFRSGGNGKGVTKAGQIIAQKWDPILHGDPVLVHERLDGSYYVADGHHRLDLANRLNAEGKGPGRIAAQVLREADGYTPLDVKIIAAYKNFVHGHFKPVDAARVFKEANSGKVHKELLPQLQMSKDNLRIAYSMSKLSDAVLDKVESQAIPGEVAAALADRVSDPAKQESVLAVIGEKLRNNGGGFAGRIEAERQSQPLGRAI